MDYDYESITLPEAPLAAITAAREALDLREGGMALDEGPEWAPVAASFKLDSDEEREVTFQDAPGPLGLDEPALPTRLALEFAGVRATAPHAVYAVEVRSAPDQEPHVVGRFSTFGLAGTAPEEARSYLVDASAALPALIDEGWTGGQLSVKLVPEEEEEQPDSDEPDRAIHVEQVTVYTQTP
jgi:hypothetical protein